MFEVSRSHCFLPAYLIQLIESITFASPYSHFPTGQSTSMYHHRQYSSSSRSLSTTFSQTHYSLSRYHQSSSDSPSSPQDLLWDSPKLSENHAYLAVQRGSGSDHLTSQPIQNPHYHLLQRNRSNCPKHLTQRQETRWLKAGHKAQENQRLITDLELFHWPENNYDTPIHIHHRTPAWLLHCMMSKISLA